MNIFISLAILGAITVSCGGSVLEPAKPAEASGLLKADGKDADTYKLILDSGYNYETPDKSGNHAQAPFRHITQSWSDELGEYVFNFILHIENDDDRGLTNVLDRQRNEIKTDGKSPAFMVAQDGETIRNTWKFRLPEGMKTTTSFSHIHQLKGIDNSSGNADVSQPLITFTVRSKSSGTQEFQIIYNEKNADATGWNTKYLARTDLKEFLGQWVEVEETVKCADKGSYEVRVVRLSDNKELAWFSSVKGTGSSGAVSVSAWDFWRDGCTGIRPKWGLYRNFGANRSNAALLRDEVLQFADFKIEKIWD